MPFLVLATFHRLVARAALKFMVAQGPLVSDLPEACAEAARLLELALEGLLRAKVITSAQAAPDNVLILTHRSKELA